MAYPRTHNERIVEQFFERWTQEHHITATVEAGLKFGAAYRAWKKVKWDYAEELSQWLRLTDALGRQVDAYSTKIEEQRRMIESLDRKCGFYQKQWLIRQHDYRVRRPRLRRLVEFLTKL